MIILITETNVVQDYFSTQNKHDSIPWMDRPTYDKTTIAK